MKYEYEQKEIEQPFCAQTTDVAPSFTTEAYDPADDQIKTIKLETYKGKWVMLFFYSSDFTFV